MHIADYIRDVLVPANTAVTAMQRAGLPIDLDRLCETRETWRKELTELKAYVEGESQKVGTPIKYSPKNGIHPPIMANFLFKGLKLQPGTMTDTGAPSTDQESLMEYASLTVPKPDDHPVVRAVLQIRSMSKATAAYLDSFEATRQSDGCCHPKYNWALRTSRLSAEDPPVHQLPEHSDERVIKGIKACIVPRRKPARKDEDWDPRVHGSCWKWDVSGAEGAVRGAVLTDHYDVRDPVLWDYIRSGKDIHSKTASLIYSVEEGTYKKGTYERDIVGKTTYFAKQFGAHWKAVQFQFWKKARVRLSDEEAERICKNFDEGYPGLTQLYQDDMVRLGKNMDANGLSFCEDAYGRQRAIQIPTAMIKKFDRVRGKWNMAGVRNNDPDFKLLQHAFHVNANTPTQSINASDTLWMLALLYHGEYVDLKVPPVWADGGIPFPEAKDWGLNEGPGPGGKPMLSWHMNTVHDSGWGDCAPGVYLEATAKLLWRRCRAVPLDWRLAADIPYRIDLMVGPDMARMEPYNKVAARFGLEPVPER
jgi:hypothetical protein